jgi:hypothetical protein
MEKVIFDGKYIVYSDGRIWSIRRNKFLKESVHHTGYKRICFNKKDYRIHRLVADAFIPNPNNLPFINHKNEDKGDNRVENLEWCDNRYNLNYSIAGKNPGLQFHKGKYDVRIYHNKKYMYLGRYFTIEEATKVRNEYIRLHNL